jgi:hypothetical protein
VNNNISGSLFGRCFHFPDHRHLVGNTMIQTLASQHAQFKFSHLQPTGVRSYKLEFKTLQQRSGLFWFEGQAITRRRMGIEIVKHGYNLGQAFLGIMLSELFSRQLSQYPLIRLPLDSNRAC